MSTVLTHKEFYERKQGRSTDRFQGSPTASHIFEEEAGSSSSKEKLFYYFLLHPENGVDTPQHFEDELEIDGQIYKRKCVNGVVVTTEKVLYEFLKKKGYALMEKLTEEELDGTSHSRRHQKFFGRI